jgi:hypothetical protein
MQNLIQLEDDVKGLPDQALQQLAQRPNPQLPQFLVVSEIQRRSDMRKRFEARQQQPQGTVAQQIVAPQQQGIGAMVPPGQQPMPPRMPMQPPMQQPMAPQGMSGGGVVRMAAGRQATFPMDQTPPQSSIIGQRINNPYNIRQYDQGFLGESGEDSGFVSFEDPMYGVRAADRVLTTYGTKRGINTIRGLINRFAPPSENDTRNYVNYISGELGIDPDAEIDLSDPEMRARILSPMAMMESRSEYSPGQITEMIEMANAPRQELRPLVPDVQVPGVDASIPEMAALPSRQGVVTTESVDLPSQELPLSKEFIEKYLNDFNFRFEMDNAKRYAQEDADEIAAKNPQSLDELMTATFGDRQTPDVALQSRQGAVSRLPELDGALPQTMRQPTGSEPGDVIRLAEDTKVDPKGLITTDNQPVGAIVEDALKAQPKDKVRPDPYVPMQGPTIKMPTATKDDSYTPMQGPTIKMPTAPEEELSLADRVGRFIYDKDDDGDISILGGLIRGERKSPEEIARIQAEKDFAMGKVPEGSFAEKEEQRRQSRLNRIAELESNLDQFKADRDTTNPSVQRQIEKRQSEIDRLRGTTEQQGQKSLDSSAPPSQAAPTEKQVDDAQQTAQTTQQQADQYIADARKARQEGLITKEDLAKKEALGAALIQLGAGIAKGDFAEGLSKAGVAAQDVREKARDRAVRSDYYEYLKTKPSTTGLTASGQNYQRLLKTVNTELEKEFGKININMMSEDLQLEYAARREQLLRELAPQFQLGDADIGPSLVDPVQAATQSATPGGINFPDMQ